MTETYQFHEIGRLPLPGDNVAIAVRRLERGDCIVLAGQEVGLNQTILEGHRFAVQPIATGETLLSWELPFGVATQPIAVGDYVCNESALAALRGRSLSFTLPNEANFADQITRYTLDEATFFPGAPTLRYPQERTFLGYRRPGGRRVGTRNTVVLLGTSSRTGSFVRQLEERMKGLAGAYANVDGVVAIAHTEGGSEQPNNLDFILRTLAGWMVHPNVGAVLAVDYGVEPVTNALLERFMREQGYPLDAVTHRFLSLTGTFEASLDACEAIVRGWLPEVNATARTAESVAHLKVALQCGGSDAFSGVSANPLISWAAREIIRYGGSANLAETDELIGAEPYVLKSVKDAATAQKFLDTVERFKARAAWHGASAEGNPSGGNKLRGLYNIVLKSIGAAMKRHPDVRLDAVIDYAEPMAEPGYYFMDSPGNDLESIAGQVAAGCNLIYFTTGNGSITNFPFVPTVKVVTTTRRYQLLASDMDVNAGAYLDGTSMDDLGAGLFERTLDVASGDRSVGEKAGHAQVQIWRNWRQTDTSRLDELLHARRPSGASLPLRAVPADPMPVSFRTLRTNGQRATDQVGLIVPTSLCAGQIAHLTALRLNRKQLGQDKQLSRFVSLVHTEGCGNSAGASEELYVRTMLAYVRHPLVKHCLLLEHGCEKTHNDFMRSHLLGLGVDPDSVGWASIQLDGGIEQVMDKVEAWFVQRLSGDPTPAVEMVGLEAARVGLASAGAVPPGAAQALGRLAAQVVAAGGSIVAPQNAGLLSTRAFLDATLGEQPAMPTLAYGALMETPGFHVMETPTAHWVETLTGLGATGVEMVVAYVGEHPLQTHPMTPILQVTADAAVYARYGDDLDLFLSGDPDAWPRQILQLLADISARAYAPRLQARGNIDFQITRGLLGVSL